MIARAADWLGPIFVREMIQLSRRRRYYVLRSACAALLLFAAYRDWNDVARYVERSGTDLRVMSELGERLFWSVVLVQCGITFVLLPIMLCDTVVAERRQGTLDGLLTSPLSDREILLGLMASRIGVAALLLAATFPILAIALLFGGVEWTDVLREFVFQVTTMFIVGSTTVYCSTICRSGFEALARSYVTLAGLTVIFGLGWIIVSLYLIAVGQTLVSQNEIDVWAVASGLAFVILVCVAAVRLLANAVTNLRKLNREPVRFGNGYARATSCDSTSFDSNASPFDFICAFARRRPLLDWNWTLVRPPESLADSAVAIAAVLVLPIFVASIALLWVFVFGSLDGPIWLWAFASFLTAFIAVRNQATSGPQGWRDVLLSTALENHELVSAYMEQTKRQLRIILIVIAALSVRWVVFSPISGIAAAIGAALFTYLVFQFGTIIAISCGRRTAALNWALLLPGTIWLGTMWLKPVLLMATPIGLSLVSLTAYGIGARLLRKGPGPASVCLCFLGMHWFLVSTIVSLPFWINHSNSFVPAIEAASPGFWFRLASQADSWLWWFFWTYPYLMLYWLALVLNLLWAWRWTIRNFDRLTGRVVQRVGVPA